MPKREALRKEFFSKIENPLLGKITRSALMVEYQTDLGAAVRLHVLLFTQETQTAFISEGKLFLRILKSSNSLKEIISASSF